MSDTTRPSAFTLRALGGDGFVQLNWDRPRDNVGVSRLELWMDDKWQRELKPYTTSYRKTGLQNGRSYKFKVVAYDRAGNYRNSSIATASPIGSSVPAPIPEPIPAPTQNPSGLVMPGDVPGWRALFEDDFNKPVALGRFPADVNDKWSAYPYGWLDTSKNGHYDAPRTVSIHDGMMDIWMHTENGEHKVAAPYPRFPSDPAVQISLGSEFSGYYFKSLRIAVRVKANPIPGYKTAWLFWPMSDTHPRDGEIDLPEGDLDGRSHVTGFMHRQNGTSGYDQEYFDGGFIYADGKWHTYVTEWVMGASCQFFADEKASPKWNSRVPATPMRYVMQSETVLDEDNPPLDSTQGHILVDWIKAYVLA
jgi:hypothetical protein